LGHCFVIMPFSSTTDKHTNLYWDDFFHKFIKPSLEKCGYSCSRSKPAPESIIKGIIKDLLNADLVLAVLTDNNPNVWYELGVRHSLKRGTVMIIEKGQRIPFDISPYGVIQYDDSIVGSSSFQEALEDFIHNIENGNPADSPVSEYLGLFNSQKEQRAEDSKKTYEEKLDKIYQLMLNFNKGENINNHLESTKIISRKKVLWVDDYPSNNEAVVDMFRRQGFEFDLAVNTSQALGYLMKEEYDLVITDLGRGGDPMAGIVTIREINSAFGSPPPIVVYSSYRAVKEFGQDAKQEGATLVTSSLRSLFKILTNLMNNVSLLDS